MLVVDRTHPLRTDLDWLPARLRAERWLRWGGAAAGAATLIAVPFLGDLVALPAAMAFEDHGPGAGDWLRSRMGALVAVETALADVDKCAEGTTVRVRAKVEVDEPLAGVLHDAPGACRRLAFKAGWRWWIHEAAVDFWLVDARGVRVPVQAAGARFLTRLGEAYDYPAKRFVGDKAPHGVKSRFNAAREDAVIASERVLRAGEEVIVVGTRTSIIDPGGESSGYREAPTRAAIAGGKELPLLVALV